MHTENFFENWDEDEADDFVIATLGNATTGVTCSLHVASYMFPGAQLQGCSSFERAAAAVRRGRANALLVPGAYPKISHFLMDENFGLSMTFKKTIPALVFANVASDRNHPLDVLFYHPATTSLHEKLGDVSIGKFEPVSSNEVAFNHMVAYGQGAGAITNQLVLDHYGHPALQTLRSERDMAWLLFERREANEGEEEGAAA